VLVQAVLRGDREAYGVLYDRYARLIRAICRDHTNDPHAAADLGQEVFLRAYGRLGTLADRDRFGAWLVAIARNVCREWHKEQRRPGPSATPLGTRDSEASCEGQCGTAVADTVGDDLDASERAAALRAALAELPERERTALHAFYVQEQSVEQIRNLLGLSRSGLYHVLAAARRRLAGMLRRQEVHP
jgi:RNA polymerase sigma-70 factor (ECF subfamily)